MVVTPPWLLRRRSLLFSAVSTGGLGRDGATVAVLAEAMLLREEYDSGSKVLVTGSGLKVTVLVARGRVSEVDGDCDGDADGDDVEGSRGVFSLMTWGSMMRG